MKGFIQINQTPPDGEMRVAIVPFGTYFNRKVAEAQPGDTVKFQQAWRKGPYKIRQIRKVRMDSAAFTFILRYVYPYVTLTELESRWSAQCEIEGFGRNGFSRDECLALEFEPIG